MFSSMVISLFIWRKYLNRPDTILCNKINFYVFEVSSTHNFLHGMVLEINLQNFIFQTILPKVGPIGTSKTKNQKRFYFFVFRRPPSKTRRKRVLFFDFIFFTDW